MRRDAGHRYTNASIGVTSTIHVILNPVLLSFVERRDVARVIVKFHTYRLAFYFQKVLRPLRDSELPLASHIGLAP